MSVINTDYAQYPEHPLHDIPQEILNAARSVTNAAIIVGDIDPDEANAIADGVVSAVIRKLTDWQANRISSADDSADDYGDDLDDEDYDRYRALEIATGDDYPR